MVLRKSFYIRWSAGRSPRVHEVNPGRDPSLYMHIIINKYKWNYNIHKIVLGSFWNPENTREKKY